MVGFYRCALFYVAPQCADTACVCVCVLDMQQDVDRLDPRGRTPLELSVCLGHLESTRVLLRYSADPTHCNAQGWTSECFKLLRLLLCFMSTGCCELNTRTFASVLQEAMSTGDPELVQLVLQYRDFKRATERLAGIPELLSKLRQVKIILYPPIPHLLNQCTLLKCFSKMLPLKWELYTVCQGGFSILNNISNMLPKTLSVFIRWGWSRSEHPFPVSSGAGLLRGDEVGVHQLGWVDFRFPTER